MAIGCSRSVPSGRPSCDACATRSPSGLRGSPRAAGQYSPFCLPGSLRKRRREQALRAFRRVPVARSDAAPRRTSRQIPITASSLRPIRRASTSSLPAAVVESPALRVLHERNRERPFLVADDERLAVGALIQQPPPFGDGDREDLAVPARGRRIGRGDQLLSVGTEDGQQFVQVPGLGRVGQRADGVFRRRERPLGGALCRDGERCAVSASTSARGDQQRTAPPQVSHLVVTGASRPPLLERELLRLLCPRELAARSDFPLE